MTMPPHSHRPENSSPGHRPYGPPSQPRGYEGAHAPQPSFPGRQGGYPGPGYPPGGGFAPPTPGYGYPPGPPGFRPPNRKSRAGVSVLIVALVVGVGVGGFFGIRALTSDDDTGSPIAGRPGAPSDSPIEGSGEVFTPPDGKPYSVAIPEGMFQGENVADDSIPSDIDLTLFISGKVADGGKITTGTLTGQAADATYKEIGQEAFETYTASYENSPGNMWGENAAVDMEEIQVGGQDAIVVDTAFSSKAEAENSHFFRLYFIDPPSGPVLLVTCDWNKEKTAEIPDICDSVVSSFEVTN
jgi:hypothetical protein